MEKSQKRRHLLTSSRDVLTRNIRLPAVTVLTSITSLYERPVYRSYGLHGSKDDDDDDDAILYVLGYFCDSIYISAYLYARQRHDVCK